MSAVASTELKALKYSVGYSNILYSNQSHYIYCIVARTIYIIEVQVEMWTQLNVLSISIVEWA